MRPWHLIGPIATVAIYALATALHRRARSLVTLPVIVTPLALIALVSLPGGDLTAYETSTRPLVWLLGPATLALAVPLARNIARLRDKLLPLFAGALSGTLAGSFSALLLARAFGLSHSLAATLAPKSVTTPIAMPISERIGGIPSLTAAIVIVTGVVGYAFGPWLLNRMGVRDLVARGVAYGTAAHGVGTAKALEEGDIVGAASGAAMVIAGVITAAIAPLLGWLAWR